MKKFARGSFVSLLGVFVFAMCVGLSASSSSAAAPPPDKNQPAGRDGKFPSGAG